MGIQLKTSEWRPAHNKATRLYQEQESDITQNCWFSRAHLMLILSNFRFLRVREQSGIVVMDFYCFTGDRSSIPTHDDSLGKWMNLRLGQPMPCEGNRVVSPRCWREIDLHIVYNHKNALPLQFNYIENIEIHMAESESFHKTAGLT